MSVAQVQLESPAQAGRFSLAATGLVDWRISRVNIVPSLVLGEGDVLLYIHGFNQLFETATLDAARLADALRFSGQTVLFSWPSRNKLFDYIADRESATWSRDALETTLDSLVTRPGVGRVNIVAHSMGAMLAIEGLRQTYARYGERLIDRIGAIILAAPDLDVDVFSASIARMRPLAARISVITSNIDRALAVVTAFPAERAWDAAKSKAPGPRSQGDRHVRAPDGNDQPRSVPEQIGCTKSHCSRNRVRKG